MLKLFRFAMLAALATGLMTLSGSRADDKKETKDKEEAKVERAEMSNSIATLVMAHNLAEFGRKTKSPEALATAALLLAKTPLHEPDAKEENPKEDGEMKAVDHKAEVAELLAEAKKMDPKSKVVTEIAEKVMELQSEKSRDVRLKDPHGRPRVFKRNFKPGETYTDKNNSFDSNINRVEEFRFYVIGSKGGAIELTATDQTTGKKLALTLFDEGNGVYQGVILARPKQLFSLTYKNRGNREQLIQFYANPSGR